MVMVMRARQGDGHGNERQAGLMVMVMRVRQGDGHGHESQAG